MALPVCITTSWKSPCTLTSFLYLNPKGRVEFSLYRKGQAYFGLFTDPDFVALVLGLDTGKGTHFHSGRNLLLTPFGCGLLADWIEENCDRLLDSADTVHPLTTKDLLQWATDLRLLFHSEQIPLSS